MRTRQLVTAIGNLCKRGSVESAGSALALEIEKVEHAARVVHESHQLDAAGVMDPEDVLAELLGSGTLVATNSSHLSKRQWHKNCSK